MKRSTSAISMDMENRKQGETLEVLDQASLPEAPTAPKRYADHSHGLVCRNRLSA